MLFYVKTTGFIAPDHIFAENNLCMLRFINVLCLLLYASALLRSQNSSDIVLIMDLLGADDPQDLYEEDVERLSNYLERPLEINSVGVAELRSCGLFSPYQVAVIEDYRSRHGGVMSFQELALMDGFGEDFVNRVRPFVRIEDDGAMLSSDKGVRHQLHARTGYVWREDEGSDGSYSAKYRLEAGGKYSVSAAVSRAAEGKAWYPSAFAGSFAWKFEKLDGQLIAGDFNARFGQGLTIWNGAFMTSLTTPDTFMKKPSGLSQPWSFTGSAALSGIAADLTSGPFVFSAMLAVPGLKNVLDKPEALKYMPAINVAWLSRNGQVSITNVLTFSPGLSQRTAITGLDAALCIKGVNLFGEISADWSAMKYKALAGMRFQAGEHLDMAVQLRSYHGEQYGAAVGGDFSFGKRLQIYGKEGFGSSRQMMAGSFTSDVSYYPVSKDPSEPWSLQVKSQMVWDMLLHPRWQIKVRISERIRTWGNPFRTDFRTDVSYSLHPFDLTFRFNLIRCDGNGLLSYLEGSYKGQTLSLYLRQGFFFIDDWDDRIYVYEHDAPGSFTAPAMYGRGLWTSVSAGMKLSSRLRMYARAAYTGYPFMEQEKKKPGKAELKLQLQCRF